MPEAEKANGSSGGNMFFLEMDEPEENEPLLTTEMVSPTDVKRVLLSQHLRVSLAQSSNGIRSASSASLHLQGQPTTLTIPSSVSKRNLMLDGVVPSQSSEVIYGSRFKVSRLDCDGLGQSQMELMSLKRRRESLKEDSIKHNSTKANGEDLQIMHDHDMTTERLTLREVRLILKIALSMFSSTI